MLAIRMQRTGRKGHAMFRVVVQDARLTPTSGKVVANVGNLDPHAQTVNLEKDKIAYYLEHGAQPSDRVARLLKREGVKMPAWVKLDADKERAIRNPDKRRSTRPEEPAAPEAPAAEEAAPAEVTETAETPEVAEASETVETPEASETEATETPEETPTEAPAEEVIAEEAPAAEAETPEAEAEAPAADADKPAA